MSVMLQVSRTSAAFQVGFLCNLYPLHISCSSLCCIDHFILRDRVCSLVAVFFGLRLTMLKFLFKLVHLGFLPVVVHSTYIRMFYYVYFYSKCIVIPSICRPTMFIISR